MTDIDTETLNFYAAEAEIYTSRPRSTETIGLEAFLNLIPAGGRILELGCGGGQDSQAMLSRGFDVKATDGSPEMAREAQRLLGRPVAVLAFGELDEQNLYDGIWANACLLHVPRQELAEILVRIRNALKPGGVFCASFKAGSQAGRDRFGRYYNYPSRDWLVLQYDEDQWLSIHIDEVVGSGYDGEETQWLWVTAIKAP